MRVVAVLTNEKPTYGVNPPFGVDAEFALLGLYAEATSDPAKRMRMMQKESSSQIRDKIFPGETVDNIASKLVEEFGGILYCIMPPSVYYVAFKDKSEALRIFNSLGNGR